MFCLSVYPDQLDLRIQLFTQDVFQTAFDGHSSVGTVSAGTPQPELNGFAFDSDDLKIAAVGLKMNPELIEPVSDFLCKIIHFNNPLQ